MPLRPRELAVRAREAATVLLRTLDQNEIVQRFLDMYAAEYRRPGRADQPGHYREQLETIRREAILAMVQRLEDALPKRLNVHVPVRTLKGRKSSRSGGAKRSRARKSKSRLRASSRGWDFAIPVLDLFREEFFVALGQALNWTEDDANEFWRDLELYEKLSEIDHLKNARRQPRPIAGGPFVDRVAFLLDPSLMEQARRAASKFHRELETATDRVLRKVLSQRRRS
jgi:hypothetical protein